MKRANRQVPVILNEDIDGIGFAGELVMTRPGFARNFLLPRQLALVATPKLQKEREREIGQATERREKEVAERQQTAERLAEETIRLTLKVGPGGRVFGSVTASDVAKAVQEQRKVAVDPKQLHGVPLAALGSATVSAKLGLGVTAQIPVQVAGEPVKDPGAAPPKAKTSPT
jgi:large subunit ribosomal protein L9